MHQLLSRARHRLFLFPVFILICRISNAQVTYTAIDIQIDTAVHHYNALSNYVNSLQPGSVTPAQVDELSAKSTAVIIELSNIMRNAQGAQQEVAEYFYNMAINEYGFAFGVAGRLQDSYTQLRRIERYMSGQTPASFPKKYLFEGKNYVVKWENFAPTQMKYFAGMAELCYDQKKYEEVFEWVRKTVAVQYVTDSPDGRNWYVYIAYTKYLEAASALDRYPDDAMEVAIAFLETYGGLSSEYKKTVADNNYKTNRTGYQFLMEIRTQRPELTNGNTWYRAAKALQLCGDAANASTCFQYAIDAQYSDYIFFQDVYQHARNTSNNTLGQNACAWEENLINTSDCAAWRTMAANWQSFGNYERANAAAARAEDCEELAVAQQAAWEKEQRKQERAAERNFSAYVGFYPIPLLTLDNDYRDYGGVVGFGIGKVGVQASYKMINRNLVVFDDLFWAEVDNPEERILWDGYRAHVALKFGDRGDGDESFFVGPLVEVVQKNFTPIKSTVFNGTNMNYLTDAVFEPQETSYNLYLNYGAHIEENHFMFEYFFGIGATRSTFDLGNDLFNRNDHAFGNTLLEYRKAERWGPIVRMGVTMGLSTKN